MSRCKIESDGHDLFVVFDGVKIAKRGDPDTPQAGQWISLEPGCVVLDKADLTQIVVEFKGVTLHAIAPPAHMVRFWRRLAARQP